MTSLTLLPTSRAGSGGRGQSAASAAAGSERERGGGVGGDAAGVGGERGGELREGTRRRGRSGARRRHSRCKGLASGRRSRGGTGEGERRDRLGLSYVTSLPDLNLRAQQVYKLGLTHKKNLLNLINL